VLTQLIEEMKASMLEAQNIDEFDDLIKDYEAAVCHVQPVAYSMGERHHLLQHHRNHMDERSNINSNVKYGNQIQTDMVQVVRNKKLETQPTYQM